MSKSSKPLIYLYKSRLCEPLITNTENNVDWQEELNKWIVTAKNDESIFLEVHLKDWNEVGERKFI
jgi:hypothetical protein